MIKLGVIALVAGLLLQPAGLALAQSSTQASAKQKVVADLKEMAAAGDVKSQVQLGLTFLTGDGVRKDDAEAVKWLRKAADQDNPVAERYLAEMYFKGRGVPADNAGAGKRVRLRVGEGDRQKEEHPALLFTQGLGGPRNVKE